VDAGQAVSFLSIAISFVLIFVVTLIIGSIINRMITRAVEAGGISFANRILGAFFGLGRGYLINLAIIFTIQLFPMEQNWAGDSKLVASFQPAVKWLDEFVQPGLDKLKSEIQNRTQNVSNTIVQGMNNIYQ
jgi:membrane protein required for colicin V production